MYVLLWPSPHTPRVGATGAGDMQPLHLPWCTLGCLPPQELCRHGGAVQGQGRLRVFPCALQRKWPQGHFVQLGGSVGTPAPPQESPGADSNGDVVTVRMRATHDASRLCYSPRVRLHVAGSPLLGGAWGDTGPASSHSTDNWNPVLGWRLHPAGGWGHTWRRRGFTPEAAGYST